MQEIDKISEQLTLRNTESALNESYKPYVSTKGEGVSQLTSSISSFAGEASNLINSTMANHRRRVTGNLTTLLNYAKSPDVYGEIGIRKFGSRNEALDSAKSMLNKAIPTLTDEQLNSVKDEINKNLESYVNKNWSNYANITTSHYLSLAKTNLDNVLKASDTDLTNPINYNEYFDNNNKKGFFQTDPYYPLAVKSAKGDVKAQDQLQKFKDQIQINLKNRAYQKAAKDSIDNAKATFLNPSVSYNEYKKTLNTPEAEHAKKVLIDAMGSTAAEEFISSNQKLALRRAANDISVSKDQLINDAKKLKMNQEEVDSLLKTRDRKLTEPDYIDTIDPKKLAVNNPYVANVNSKLDLNSYTPDGTINIDGGLSKSLLDIQNDTELSEDEKIYQEKILNQLANLKKKALSGNHLDYASSIGHITPYGYSTISPENKITDRIKTAKNVKQELGGDLTFLTSREEGNLVTKPELMYSQIKDLKDVLASSGTAEELGALRGQIEKNGSTLYDLIDNGVTKEDIINYQKNIKDPRIGDKFVIPKKEFIDSLTSPTLSAFHNLIVEKGKKYEGGFFKSLSSEERKAAEIISNNPQLQNALYESYKVKTVAKGEYQKMEIPTPKKVLNDAGLDIYNMGVFNADIYYRKGALPEQAISNIRTQLLDAGEYYRSTMEKSSVGFIADTVQKFARGITKPEDYTPEKGTPYELTDGEIKDRFIIKNLDADVIGLFQKSDGKPVIDPRTGKQFVSKITYHLHTIG